MACFKFLFKNSSAETEANYENSAESCRESKQVHTEYDDPLSRPIPHSKRFPLFRKHVASYSVNTVMNLRFQLGECYFLEKDSAPRGYLRNPNIT